MELAIALDPVAAPTSAPDAKPVDNRPTGTDADDPATQAFASLLATMLTPPPPPAPTVDPEGEAAGAGADALVAATDLTAALALPAPAGAVEGAAGADLPADAPIESLPTPFVPADAATPVLPPAEVAPAPILDDVAADAPEPAVVDDAAPAPVERPSGAAPAPAAHVPATPALDTVPVVAVTARSGDPSGEGEARNRAEAPATTPVTGPAPTTSATPFPAVLRPEAVAAPVVATPAPATPAAQVVRAVAPLRHLGEGNHNVVLELHPAELGAVRVELTLNAGVVHLGLQAEMAATGHLLRNALPELRSQLDAAGLVAGRLAVDSGQSGPGQGGVPWRTAERAALGALAGGDEPEQNPTPTPTPTSVAPGRVDVRL